MYIALYYGIQKVTLKFEISITLCRGIFHVDVELIQYQQYIQVLMKSGGIAK
jgi:hypothetical protein